MLLWQLDIADSERNVHISRSCKSILHMSFTKEPSNSTDFYFQSQDLYKLWDKTEDVEGRRDEAHILTSFSIVEHIDEIITGQDSI